MGFDKVKMKQIRNLILLVAALILLLIYSETVFKTLGIALGIIMPFIIGGVIAFILNLPLRAMEEKWFHKWKGKKGSKLIRPISILLSILFVLAIIALVAVAVIPQLRTTITILGNKIPGFVENVVAKLATFSVDYPLLHAEIVKLTTMEFNWNAIVENVAGFLKVGVTNMLASTVNVASNIVVGIVNFVISFIFALYILSQKEKLASQGERILSAYFKKERADKIKEVLRRLYNNFSHFICGQCLEAIILGVLFIIAMSIFGMPYAIMIGTLIAFTALVPVVGAFIGCGVGAFMILIDNPLQALWFIIMFLIIQQIEGNVIYPKVVGDSVGLPAIWVLLAVTVGGSLFGVAGMLCGIPVLSTIYSLVRDDVNKRNQPVKVAKTNRKTEKKDNGEKL